MPLFSNVKGSSVSTVILWLGALVGFLIVYGWYITYIQPSQLSFEMVNTDVSELQNKLNLACGSTRYSSWYNPITELGNLTINNSMICIQTVKQKKCLLTICDTNITSYMDLSNITYVNIYRDLRNRNFTVWGGQTPLNTTYVSPFRNVTNTTNGTNGTA